ncbi:MAG: hypothetical protein GEU73_11140 [Chloroflexi bacterium]|nr:hypothetical protein [Chloroflexota bacterium]
MSEWGPIETADLAYQRPDSVWPSEWGRPAGHPYSTERREWATRKLRELGSYKPGGRFSYDATDSKNVVNGVKIPVHWTIRMSVAWEHHLEGLIQEREWAIRSRGRRR